mmetsp:Transcript_11202/g.12063  ORF Transcript_11202/g.12063 Transcript_11202/m.12063 type:complete len:83 (-) Transcript_11202:2471-2719(-)
MIEDLAGELFHYRYHQQTMRVRWMLTTESAKQKRKQCNPIPCNIRQEEEQRKRRTERLCTHTKVKSDDDYSMFHLLDYHYYY